MRLTPEKREQIVRILTEIRADLGQLRERFERVRDRLEAQEARREQPDG